VINGIPHFDVYVKDIPIRSKAIELEKLAMKRKIDGSKNIFAACSVCAKRGISFARL
jgi:hypothetical protein